MLAGPSSSLISQHLQCSCTVQWHTFPVLKFSIWNSWQVVLMDSILWQSLNTCLLCLNCLEQNILQVFLSSWSSRDKLPEMMICPSSWGPPIIEFILWSWEVNHADTSIHLAYSGQDCPLWLGGGLLNTSTSSASLRQSVYNTFHIAVQELSTSPAHEFSSALWVQEERKTCRRDWAQLFYFFYFSTHIYGVSSVSAQSENVIAHVSPFGISASFERNARWQRQLDCGRLWLPWSLSSRW